MSKIHEISYPSTRQEALAILPKMKAVFGNCEEYSFELNFNDEECVENISLLCDTVNETITIFHFSWLRDSGHEKAVECVDSIHLNTKDATIMADMLKYYVTILK